MSNIIITSGNFLALYREKKYVRELRERMLKKYQLISKRPLKLVYLIFKTSNQFNKKNNMINF